MAAQKCWDGYEKRGTKKGKSGKTVNNCVKKERLSQRRSKMSAPSPANLLVAKANG